MSGYVHDCLAHLVQNVVLSVCSTAVPIIRAAVAIVNTGASLTQLTSGELDQQEPMTASIR